MQTCEKCPERALNVYEGALMHLMNWPRDNPKPSPACWERASESVSVDTGELVCVLDQWGLAQ